MTAVGMLSVGLLRVGGVGVVVRTNCELFAASAGSVFADLLAEGPIGSVSVPPVVFEVSCQPAGEHRWSITRDGAPCEMSLSDDGVLPHLQWELNRLMIEVNPTSVHAAAVSGPTGGVLIAGRSCSGKSTLAGWLAVHHGFGYLGDEVGAINEAGEVLPFPRPVGVRAESPLAGLVSDWAGEAERVLPISTLGGVVCRTPTLVSLLVFPRFQAGMRTPVLARVGQAESLMRLAELTPGLGVYGRVVFEQLARLAGTTPAFDVVYGHVGDGARLVAARAGGG